MPKLWKMRAVIDVGTNSVRLLLAQVKENRIMPVHKEVAVTRLGAGVDASGLLGKEGIRRTLIALEHFKRRIPAGVPTSVLATSAVRQAANRDQFLNKLEMETNWATQVLAGTEEARLSFFGAVASLGREYLQDPVTVLDIGGGSTEIYTGLSAGQILGGGSAEVGAVRLLERFLTSHPVLEYEQAEMEKVTVQLLQPLTVQNLAFRPQTLVAVGGTALSVAAIKLNLNKFTEQAVAGSRLTTEEVKEIYARLLKMSLEERRQIKSMQPGREDILVCGAGILWQAAVLLGFKQLMISAGDLLSGYLLQAVDAGE